MAHNVACRRNAATLTYLDASLSHQCMQKAVLKNLVIVQAGMFGAIGMLHAC